VQKLLVSSCLKWVTFYLVDILSNKYPIFFNGKIKMEKICEKIEKIIDRYVIESKLNVNYNHKPDFSELENRGIISNLYFYIYNVSNKEIEFINENLCKLLGYEKEEISYNFLHSKIHPDDLMNVINNTINALKIAHLYQDIDWKRNQFCINFRIQNSIGLYIKVLRQTCILLTDNNNRSLYALARFTDITHTTSNDCIESYFEGPDICKINEDDLGKLKLSKKIFSECEIKILILMKTGLNNKQIGDYLHLSVYTVETHKKNMMHRTKTINSTHLISYAIDNGYLK
jgi:DNA-binding CsgD family transcriptional regulator